MTSTSTHIHTHVRARLTPAFSHARVNKIPASVLGGSRRRTNSLPLPDKEQEVMRWAGRGQLPVSCENSNSS